MSKGKKMYWTTAAAAFILTGGTVITAAAQDVYDLNPVVVTAQRTETKDLDTPASTEVITAKQLQNTGSATVFDALSRVPGFNSMSYGGGTQQDYGMSTSRAMIRGFDKGTLVLVNGAPMNLLNYNTMAGIPVAAVDRVEIVKGASSVMYGAEALSGVVNIITKKPTGKMGVTVGSSYGNYLSDYHIGVNTGRTSVYYQKQFTGRVSLTSLSGITKTTGGAVTPYGLDAGKNDSLFLTTQLTDKLNLNWNYYDQQTNRPSYTNFTRAKRSMLYRYHDIRNNVNLIYDDKNSNFKSVLAYNKRTDHANKYTYSSGVNAVSERYDMYSLTSDTQKKWNLRNGKDSLLAGVTFSRENYRGLPSSAATSYNSAHRDNLSLYSSYSYAATPDFTTIIGLRGQHSSDYAKDENVFLPQIQTLYKLNDHTSWFINIGKAFQMPALNQYFNKAGTDFNRLKPQEGWTYETGVKWIEKTSSVKVSVYHMDIQDAFKWKKNPDNTDYLANAGNFRNTGVEAEYTKHINDAWSLDLGVSYSNPKDNENGQWERDNARTQYTAGVTYDKEKWTANVNYLFMGNRQTSYYLIHNQAADVPAYINLAANVQYRPNSSQAITLTMNNICGRDNPVNEYENLDLPYNWRLAYSYSF